MQRAFQDQILGNYCWGCGSLNECGLHIKSYWSGDEATCTWTAKDYHTGPRHILNGGIIATIMDCHCVCTAMAAAYRTENRAMDTEPPIWFATGSLSVKYLRPTPVDASILLRARIKERGEKKTILTCSLFAKEKECAQAEVVAVRIPKAFWFESSI